MASTSPVTPIPPAQQSRSRGRLALTLGLGFVIAIIGLTLVVWTSGGSCPRAAIASGAHAAVDPRLILHARASVVRSALNSGVRVDGTLYPSLPGPNTLRLTMPGMSGAPGRAASVGRVEVVVTMPGMAMPPIAATLTAHGRDYAGIIGLPMFGDYRARLVVRTPAGKRYTGAIALTVPLDVAAVAN